MIPWHEFYTKIIETNQTKLTDQEYFCLWCINASQKSTDNLSVHQLVMKASKSIYQSPVFEDELEIDYYLDQLKEKGYIYDPEGVVSFRDNDNNLVQTTISVSKAIN